MSQRAERFPCFYGTKRGIEINKNILNTRKNILALTVDKLQFLTTALAQNFTINASQELSCMCHLLIIQAVSLQAQTGFPFLHVRTDHVTHSGTVLPCSFWKPLKCKETTGSTVYKWHSFFAVQLTAHIYNMWHQHLHTVTHTQTCISHCHLNIKITACLNCRH